ncbi:TonB-dependent receptor [Methylobacillus arboreus]|uniref:TonB-dependent receptor domain-containing protein n=1 Tax=Methylobacillus arboreus TaxID=755170 RepID=UPI001E51A04E|nr:TonB-dependent receptor [Methylobacillus arboreus]MCB5189700.1 TonB-dependent receptor [Methylobacillus arboreus]
MPGFHQRLTIFSFFIMTIASSIMLNRSTLLALALLLPLAHQPLIALAEDVEEEEQTESIEEEAPAILPLPSSTSAIRSNTQDTVLPETSISSSRIRDERINKTQSITRITSEDLERTQVSNIFDAVRGTPGVNIAGGPRLNGMAFNIRGYTESDVAVSVDGVLKNYDKYRSKGTYIEPDLLKTIEIRRGPQINTNSGFLGGAVITTTKDAEDFLRPNQIVGGRVKFGYGNNNDEYLRSYLAYARPHERIDLLYSYTDRQSNDITQGDGEKLAYSTVGTVAELYKITVFPIDSLKISTSMTKLKQSPTVQLYDTLTDGLFTSSPYVMRAIDEETISQTITFTPESRWVDLKAIIGTGHTKQDETLPFGWQGNRSTVSGPNAAYCIGYTGYRISNNTQLSANQSAAQCRGDRLDAFSFKNTNFDLSNTSYLYESTDIRLTLLAGIQYVKQKRELERSFGNPLHRPTAQEPASGVQTTTAFYVQPALKIKQLSLTPGYRRDFVELKAIDDTKESLLVANQAEKIKLREEIFNLGLAYEPTRNLTLFTNYSQGFRAVPLAVLWSNMGRNSSTGVLETTSSCPDDGSSCDDVYKTQRVENTEIGTSYINPNLFERQIQLTSKITFFHSHTSNLIFETGLQNGKETRNGWEFENSIYYRNFYAQASYSRVDGTIYYFAEGVSGPIYTIPGKTFNLTLGSKLGDKWDVNINYRHVSDRYYAEGIPGPTSGIAVQPGYEVFNAGVRWMPNQHLNFRLVGENLGDKYYNLDGGFAGQLGLVAPGRNIKFYAEFIY